MSWYERAEGKEDALFKTATSTKRAPPTPNRKYICYTTAQFGYTERDLRDPGDTRYSLARVMPGTDVLTPFSLPPSHCLHDEDEEKRSPLTLECLLIFWEAREQTSQRQLALSLSPYRN